MNYVKGLITRLGICAILLVNSLVSATGPARAANEPRSQATPSGCSVIYNGGNGWIIDLCTTDPNVTTPMVVFLNGVSKGNAVAVRVYHKAQSDPGTPQVAVIYSSGFIRLKQNNDPSPSIPFGTSFILGPAYYDAPNGHHLNPQLTKLEIDTSWLPDSPLRMKAQGTNHAFNVNYNMELPPPNDAQTRLHVTQTYTATTNVNIDPTRRAQKEGFKLVQASSMFISETGSCDGGYTQCHDSNGVRFIAGDLSRRQRAFKDIVPPSLIFSFPAALGTTWVDVLHTDDQSWQSQTGNNTNGNTPNTRIVLDELPTGYTITPQGRIFATTNPNFDNVNVWLHDDRSSSASWMVGRSDRISYWLLAQDNPPDPWGDQGRRPGVTFLNFDGSYNCVPVKQANQPTTLSVTPIAGYADRSLQLGYNIGSANGNWAQVRCNFNPPLNLSAYDHLRFEWRGSSAANSLEVGLVNPNPTPGGNELIFGRLHTHVSQHSWWGQMVIPFKFLQPWKPNTQFDPAQVSAIFFSVLKYNNVDPGGGGSLAVDNLGAFNVASRPVPASFETVNPNPVAAQSAANWLASQQQPTGLLRSWDQDPTCWAYTYDQALALIVFAKQGMWPQANALAERLSAVQNPDGSWYQHRDCNTLVVPANSEKWEGDIAWAIYALRRYLDLGGTYAGAGLAIQKGASWLATRINSADGCLVKDHTEATIDAWWAFQAGGNPHAYNAERIKNCLLTYFWDYNMGRFKGGRNWWQPYLDNQTWGAGFLKAVGEDQKARRALSYAPYALFLPAQGGQLSGFDGQAGPWSVWHEGTAQYAAVGGQGAGELLLEVLAQQKLNGAVPGSPDAFSGGGVWTSRWHGVAPTAWLYFALTGEPFHASPKNIDITIGSQKRGSYYVPAQGTAQANIPGVSNGPVKIVNTEGRSAFGGERVIFRVNGVPTSFSEMMAIPDSQADTIHWLPWYNNVDLDTQLRFANVSGSPATVHISIGGQEMQGSPIILQPGTSTGRSFVGVNAGPVKFDSDQNIVASERVIYKVNGVPTSFSEMMALPNREVSRTYWLPWYNNVDLDTQLRIANLSSSVATVNVYIGGQPVTGSPFDLQPGESARRNFAVNAGPVKIVSNQNIVVSERLIYKMNNIATSFSEMMAMPNSQVNPTFWLPWYDNVNMDTQLRFANVSSSPASVHVYIGGQEMQGSPFNLAAGESTRQSFAVTRGPVQVVGTQNLVVAERVIYKVNNVPASFSEMMALPAGHLDIISWLTWYNNVDLDTQLRFGVP